MAKISLEIESSVFFAEHEFLQDDEKINKIIDLLWEMQHPQEEALSVGEKRQFVVNFIFEFMISSARTYRQQKIVEELRNNFEQSDVL